jgi:hypothetical protein
MSAKLFTLILVDLAIATVIARFFFKTFRNFINTWHFLLLPEGYAITSKQIDKDIKYTYKLLFLLVLLVAIVLVEVKLFY